jgi:hypothetical protein
LERSVADLLPLCGHHRHQTNLVLRLFGSPTYKGICCAKFHHQYLKSPNPSKPAVKNVAE